uniref:Paraflagellar rod protein n=1 Tax=Trypanosoma vivax (strain Y486) TaxID=1055687 RepID=G0U585_TRYVY|nr:hypothetical protein TVY486_1000870 [Trypanosoma vivax Y486]
MTTLSKERDNNVIMRRLLESVNFDLDKYIVATAQKAAENQKLQEEAADIRQTVSQVEFCDMAKNEIRVKWEDLRTLEAEVRRMNALNDDNLIERKRSILLHSYRKLHRFGKDLIDALGNDTRFNTGSLESQRLTLIDDASTFTKEVVRCMESL